MGLLWLATLFVVTGIAVAGAKGAKQKLLNLLIIVACVALGLGIGYAIGFWGKNMAIGVEAAVPLGISLGVIAAVGCWQRNRMRRTTRG